MTTSVDQCLTAILDLLRDDTSSVKVGAPICFFFIAELVHRRPIHADVFRTMNFSPGRTSTAHIRWLRDNHILLGTGAGNSRIYTAGSASEELVAVLPVASSQLDDIALMDAYARYSPYCNDENSLLTISTLPSLMAVHAGLDSLQDVSNRLWRDSRTVGRSLQKLAQAGLVRVCKSNARSKAKISVTMKGNTLVDSLMHCHGKPAEGGIIAN